MWVTTFSACIQSVALTEWAHSNRTWHSKQLKMQSRWCNLHDIQHLTWLHVESLIATYSPTLRLHRCCWTIGHVWTFPVTLLPCLQCESKHVHHDNRKAASGLQINTEGQLVMTLCASTADCAESSSVHAGTWVVTEVLLSVLQCIFVVQCLSVKLHIDVKQNSIAAFHLNWVGIRPTVYGLRWDSFAKLTSNALNLPGLGARSSLNTRIPLLH